MYSWYWWCLCRKQINNNDLNEGDDWHDGSDDEHNYHVGDDDDDDDKDADVDVDAVVDVGADDPIGAQVDKSLT